jgi:flagellar motility protein MotE (MotC chaperone)
MSAKWWTLLVLAAAAKVYLLGSWLWSGDPSAHATPPANEAASAAKGPAIEHAAKASPLEGREPARAEVQADLDVDDAAEKLRAAPHPAATPHKAPHRGQPAVRASSKETIVGSPAEPNAAPSGDASGAVPFATPRACVAALAGVAAERSVLDAQRAALATLRAAVEARDAKAARELAQAKILLARAEATVGRALEERDAARRASIHKLSKLLSGMKPVDAASLLARIAVPHAVAALRVMDEGKASKLMGFVAAEHAARLSEALLADPAPSPDAKAQGGAQSKPDAASGQGGDPTDKMPTDPAPTK